MNFAQNCKRGASKTHIRLRQEKIPLTYVILIVPPCLLLLQYACSHHTYTYPLSFSKPRRSARGGVACSSFVGSYRCGVFCSRIFSNVPSIMFSCFMVKLKCDRFQFRRRSFCSGSRRLLAWTDDRKYQYNLWSLVFYPFWWMIEVIFCSSEFVLKGFASTVRIFLSLALDCSSINRDIMMAMNHSNVTGGRSDDISRGWCLFLD